MSLFTALFFSVDVWLHWSFALQVHVYQYTLTLQVAVYSDWQVSVHSAQLLNRCADVPHSLTWVGAWEQRCNWVTRFAVSG